MPKSASSSPGQVEPPSRMRPRFPAGPTAAAIHSPSSASLAGLRRATSNLNEPETSTRSAGAPAATRRERSSALWAKISAKQWKTSLNSHRAAR